LRSGLRLAGGKKFTKTAALIGLFLGRERREVFAMKPHCSRPFVFVCCAFLSLAALVSAAAGKRVSLFDGKTLAGWKLVTCEAVVQDGQILLQAGNGLVQTERKYGDFVFEFEWKPLKAEQWDSGIYFRYDSMPAGKRPWPLRYQVNLRQGEEGDIPGLKGAKSKGLFRAREWNKVKLTVQGARATLEVNGQPAWSAEGLEGPREGFIGLQSEVPGGGQHLFRNIFVTEL
jgi:hypothetical protein